MPPPATNLILWVEADAGVYTDTSGTIPATADGDLVALWKDQSGQGNDLTQATSGHRPALKLAIVNGKPVLRFVSANSKSISSGNVANGIVAGDCWFAWVAQASAASAFNTVFAIGAFIPAFYWPSTTGSFPAVMQVYLSGGNNYSANINLNTFYLTEFGRISGTCKVWQGGPAMPVLDVVTHTLGAFGNNTPFNLGTDGSGGDFFDGDIAELLVYNASLSSGDQATLEAYLIAKYWAVPVIGSGAPLMMLI